MESVYMSESIQGNYKKVYWSQLTSKMAVCNDIENYCVKYFITLKDP